MTGDYNQKSLPVIPQRSTDWDSPLGYKQVISHCTRRISLLLTLVLGFASDSCNNNDRLLVVGYNYNLYTHTHIYTHIYIHTHNYIHTHIYAHTHIYTDTYIYTHIYTHNYIYTHIHIHTHTYIYVTVWAKTRHVRTQTEIYFITPAYSYTK